MSIERERQKEREGTGIKQVSDGVEGSSEEAFLLHACMDTCCRRNAQGGGSTCSTAAVTKAVALSVCQCSELTQASIWPYFMITINA